MHGSACRMRFKPSSRTLPPDSSLLVCRHCSRRKIMTGKTTVTQLLLLAGIMFGAVVAKGALAAEPSAASVPAGAGLQTNHIAGFDPPPPTGAAMPPPHLHTSAP